MVMMMMIGVFIFDTMPQASKKMTKIAEKSDLRIIPNLSAHD